MKKSDLKIFVKIPTLYTDRLVLRRMEISDTDDVYEYASDPRVSEYLMWYPHNSKEYTKAYLKRIKTMYRRADFYDWAIIVSGKMIGTVGFTSFDIPKNSAEIGYVLNSEFWGKGIAYEAVNKIFEFGFSVLQLDRIEAVILPDNVRSRHLLEKCAMSSEGIKREAINVKGEYRDIEIFSIKKDKYELGNK